MNSPVPAVQPLDEPAPRAARIIALGLLGAAAAARQRVDPEGDDPEGDDPEALHDFRVAVRRLRSWLRAARPCLGDGGVPGRLRRRLRRVAHGTGGARDVEVQLAWLHGQRDLGRGRRAAGVGWLTGRLERQRGDASAADVAAAVAIFDRLRGPLAESLCSYTVTCRVDAPCPPTMAAAMAPLLRDHARKLGQRLAAVDTAGDDAGIHAARIAGKRLRYLLEPIAGEVEGAPALVERLRDLQAMLGDVHDAGILAAQVAAAAGEAAAERARRLAGLAAGGEADDAGPDRREPSGDPEPGLLAVARRVREHRDERAAVFAAAWLAGGTESFLADVETVAGRLESGRGAPVEIERKFLLDALPEAARLAAPRRIAQGYLPGTELVERVRRVTMPDGTICYWRTVKLGTGIARIEVEEETTRAVFRALWALTRGRRIAKRRHVVPDGALTWEIDAFDDRDLVLAEVELESADEDVTIPDWLVPHVVREVTGEDGYVNANLAS